MNPYASFLADRDPVAVIASTGRELQAILSGLTGEHINHAPAPGKWSIREILCHLADCEIVFAFRIRQGLAEDRHVIQPFDQDTWARQYAAYTAGAALAAFVTVRDWNVALVRTLSAEAMARPLTHPERGTMTLQTVIDTMGGHDINHLLQVQRLAGLSAAT